MSCRDLKGLKNWWFSIILDIYRPSSPHLNKYLARNPKAASIFWHLAPGDLVVESQWWI